VDAWDSLGNGDGAGEIPNPAQVTETAGRESPCLRFLRYLDRKFFGYLRFCSSKDSRKKKCASFSKDFPLYFMVMK
jgi:hypothetical protein